MRGDYRGTVSMRMVSHKDTRSRAGDCAQVSLVGRWRNEGGVVLAEEVKGHLELHMFSEN